MTKKFRYGIVGCGAAGKVHAFHFSRHPAIEPFFCVDENRDRAGEFQRLFQFPASFDSLEEALRTEKIDILSIATPPVFHAEQIKAAARHGVHVFCEKPLFTHPEEAQPTLEACRDHGNTLGVMLPRRFYHNTLASRTALREGRLGDIREARLQLDVRKEMSYYDGWRGQRKIAGGGVLMSQAIHSIDQLVFLFGPATGVSGRLWRIRNAIDVEDEAEGVICFRDNLQVSMRATTNSETDFWRGITEIIGSRGRIVLDSEKSPIWEVPGMERPPEEESEEIPPSLKPSYFGPGHKKVIGNFVASLSGAEELRASGESSLGAMRIIWDLYRRSSLYVR